ncbi:hypothetical protein Tco_1032649 [Tanacetum coccineum]|uniref:Uncharacterized protein n=1 Tax=Tanacetum coccineum TaxID=301880 RepID=A0ABQ5GCF5_9ASTR
MTLETLTSSLTNHLDTWGFNLDLSSEVEQQDVASKNLKDPLEEEELVAVDVLMEMIDFDITKEISCQLICHTLPQAETRGVNEEEPS